MITFTITTTEVLAVAGLDTGDATLIAHANRFLGAGKFQEGLEQRLKVSARDTALLDVKEGLVRLVAAEVVALLQRADPSSLASLQVAGATVGKTPDLAVGLRAEGNGLLDRYWARTGAIITPEGISPASSEVQEGAFGRGELSRVRERE